MEPSRTTPGVNRSAPSRGVTLVELLVVLAIIGVISVVVITSKTKFDQTQLLANTAYDVALTVRSAQTYGLGSQISGKIPASQTNVGYGVHFDKGAKSFVLFADTDASSPSTVLCHPATTGVAAELPSPDRVIGDCSYLAGSDIAVSTYTFGNGVSISKVNAYNSLSGTLSPDQTSSGLDVVFSRPNTQTFVSTGGYYDPMNFLACVELVSSQGGVKSIYVRQSGEINVSSGACAATAP